MSRPSAFVAQSYRRADRMPVARSAEEAAAWRLLDAVWDVPLGLGLCDAQPRFVRVNDALARFDGLAVPAHYRDDTLQKLPAPFADGLRAANAGDAHDVEFEISGRCVLRSRILRRQA